MLKGQDISHYQTATNSEKYDFTIMKATEGKTYKDQKLDFHYDNVNGSKNGKKNENKLYGFYHYARPENGNTYKQEADNFLKYVKHHAGNCLYILDWEGKALADKYTTWAKNWLDYVYKKTGVKPLIYLQQSEANKIKKYSSIAKSDYGLWVARYKDGGKDKNPGATGAWNFWAMYQYTDKPRDLNYFNGNKKQFKKYCEKKG